MKLQQVDKKTKGKLGYKLPSKYDIGFVATSELVPYARNARVHTEQQVAQIRASIREFGWTYPILCDPTGDIIAGHGRLMAAQAEGIERVPVIVLDHLNEQQRKALRIADNKHALNSTWDFELLAAELKELRSFDPDMDLANTLGFSEAELHPLIEGTWIPPRNPDAPEHDGEGGKSKTAPLFLTPDERVLVERAVLEMRAENDALEEEAEGAVVAAICRAWLQSR